MISFTDSITLEEIYAYNIDNNLYTRWEFGSCQSKFSLSILSSVHLH